ncbi:prepilin-type N-terminal cleavage/methylation domain-containing protein [uncultured Jatrophihabitans sp.]|uniref:prepilin-type N-terminal cleavage/methylation domain-containing protein n=1 Tax=uncultured Jatrophihabitans sp. TaxID=1610747 RepID=UPI0035CB1995
MPPSRVRPPLRRAPGASTRPAVTPTDRVADDGGFTVVEALVSLVLLAVVGTAATTAVVAATKTSKNSNDRVNAANLAQQDLQAARALRYPAYPAAVSARSVVIGKTSYTVTRTVSTPCPATINYTSNPFMTVTSTVTWKPATPTQTVVMTTELAC